jgi:polar amino acid transport system substrate-binding protein
LLSALLVLPIALAAEPRVLVLNEANEPPYSNAERTGFFDVVAIEAFRRAGLTLRIETVPAGRALLLSNSGVSDGELNRLSGFETLYPNLIRVPEKLGDWQFAAFSKDASIPGNFDAIRGRSVGYIRGWRIYEQGTVRIKDLTKVNGPEQLFRLLQLDRIEVALYVRWMGVEHLRRHGIKGVGVLEPSLFIREEFIYLHKSRAEHVPEVASALQAMKRDGTYQRIRREKLLPHITEGLE